MGPPATIEHADGWSSSRPTAIAATRADPRTSWRDRARTAARGGVVLIPAFAVGRAQPLLHYLQGLKAAGTIPAALPIYVDSPMATSVTSIYLAHRDEHRLTEEECRRWRASRRRRGDALLVARLYESSWPMVIIAGSGMATGGRVLHHLGVSRPIRAPPSCSRGSRRARAARRCRRARPRSRSTASTCRFARPCTAWRIFPRTRTTSRSSNGCAASRRRRARFPHARRARRGRRAAQAHRGVLGWSARAPDYLEIVESPGRGPRSAAAATMGRPRRSRPGRSGCGRPSWRVHAVVGERRARTRPARRPPGSPRRRCSPSSGARREACPRPSARSRWRSVTASALVVSGRTTRNSSPPHRITTSESRAISRSAAAAWASTRSPIS